jgi:hypothetical protein
MAMLKRQQLWSSMGTKMPLPRWSPDGGSILVRQLPLGTSPEQGLRHFAVAATGGEVQELPGHYLALTAGMMAPGPDGLVAGIEGDGSQSWTGKRLAIADLSSGDLTLLTGEGDASLMPTWSPNFEQLAYVAGPDAGHIDRGSASAW